MKIVLIADDSPVIRKIGRRIMEDMGFIVTEARDGSEAISICQDNMPDVVIVDWEMPGMSGTEVIGQIARMENAESSKLIYCTSELLVPEMMRAKRAGASAFLMKPFNRKLLSQKFAEIGLLDSAEEAA